MAQEKEQKPFQPKGWIFDQLPAFAGRVLPPIILFWARTLRLKRYHLEHISKARREGGVIMASWHGNTACPVYIQRNRGVSVLVSPVWLGDLIGSVLKGLGFNLIRSSTNFRNIGELKKLIRTLRENKDYAVALDGASGPNRSVQAGVITIASLTGKPIILGYAAAEWKIHFPTWDHYELPLPFSRVALCVTEPIYVPRRLTDEDRAHFDVLLKKRLEDLEVEAKDRLAAMKRA
ncbi:DUF374 domain-containing protein [bacterium]|nr:DUF374 domain-containing protein [bacterium]